MTKLKVGDSVEFINDTTRGQVLAVDGATIVVKDAYGFEHRVPADEVIRRSKEADAMYAHSFHSAEAYRKDAPAEAKRPVQKGAADIWELDLHYHELSDTDQAPSQGFLLSQMKHLETVLSQAVERGIKEVIVIHGVGEGVLRSHIRAYVMEWELGQCLDADFTRYGRGATRILLA